MRRPPWLSRTWLIGDIAFVGMWVAMSITDAVRQDWGVAALHFITGVVLGFVYLASARARHHFEESLIAVEEARSQYIRAYNLMMTSNAAGLREPEDFLRAQQN